MHFVNFFDLSPRPPDKNPLAMSIQYLPHGRKRVFIQRKQLYKLLIIYITETVFVYQYFKGFQ